MTNISFKNYSCKDIIDEFEEEKLEARFQTLYDEMSKFIEINNLNGKTVINKAILANVVIDYFNDISRLKAFHVDIHKANSEKVIAYTAYWLLYRKPIQITANYTEEKQLTTINERFVLQYILNYLSERPRKGHILERKNRGLENFSGLMLYYLTYRPRDAQSLEMIITAFLAGQIYESTDIDISSELHPYDN